MPKTPIVNRTAFYEVLRDGTVRDLEWNLVQTTLGAMVEPRTLLLSTANLQAQDPYDSGITERRLNPGVGLFEFTGGQQWPATFNTL